MNSTCILLLSLTVFGAMANAFVPQYGSGLGYDLGYGAGFGGGYGTGFGGRTAGVLAPTICDHCHCVKTIVGPSRVERIPYTCTRRVQTSGCGAYPGTSADVFAGAAAANGFINGGFRGRFGAYGAL